MDWLKGKSTGSHFPLKYAGGPVKFPLNQSIESTIPPIAASVEDISWEDHSCSHISHWIWESSGWCGTRDKLITTYRLGMVFSYYTRLWWYWRLVEVGDFRVYLFVLLMTDPSVAQICKCSSPVLKRLSPRRSSSPSVVRTRTSLDITNAGSLLNTVYPTVLLGKQFRN